MTGIDAPPPRLFVDGWDPSYGASFEAAGGPAAPSSAQVDADVEVPADEWRAVDVPAGVRPRTWCCSSTGYAGSTPASGPREHDGASYPGIAASYAAGVVRCDLRRGAAELAGARVARGLFTASPSAGDVLAGRSATACTGSAAPAS